MILRGADMRWSISSLNPAVRRAWLCRIAWNIALFLSLMAASPVAATSMQDEGTPPPAAIPGVAEQTRLFDDLPILLDRIGRVPVGRITFESDASLSSEFIRVPLVAVVEKGTFDVTVDGVVTNVGPLDRIHIAGNARTRIKNIGSTTGSWIAVAQLGTETSDDFALWVAPETEPSPGVLTNARALKVLIREVRAPKLLSVDLLDIPAGMAVDSLDLDGSTATKSLIVVVVKGAIQPSDGDRLAEGESVELAIDDAPTAWRAVSASSTTLLIVRVAEAPAD